MRIQHWITAVTLAAWLLAGQSPIWGQTMPSGAESPFGVQFSESSAYPGMVPGPQGYAGPPVYTAGGPADPNVIYPQSVPEDFQPWPQISPFYPTNARQTQTYNKDGLWFKEILYRRRKFFGSIEAMAIKYRDPGSATIGSPYTRTGNFGALGAPIGTPIAPYAGVFPEVDLDPLTLQGYFILTDTVFPFPLLADGTGTLVAAPTDYLYPIWNADVIGSPHTKAGLQGRLGYENEDGTGIMLTGWGGDKGTSSFSRGTEYINGILVNQTILNTYLISGGSLLTTQNGNIPLDNGESIPGLPEFGTGSTAKYDLFYGLKFYTQAAGANMSIYQQPIYRNGGVRIRPLWGLRYLYISEGLAFRGVDSGYTYEYDEVDTTSGGGTSDDVTNRPDSVTQLYSMYTATLNNTVRSNLAGPEIGIRFDLGDSRKGFNVWGETIFGLTANMEEIHLYGDKIGDPLADVRVRGYTTPRILDPNNDTTFDTTSHSTHVSPLFQQSIFADFDFIDVIPILRDMAILDHSTFRVGYTFLLVGEVSRPADSTKWQGYPLYPEIQRNRQTWWAQQVNFALDFNF